MCSPFKQMVHFCTHVFIKIFLPMHPTLSLWEILKSGGEQMPSAGSKYSFHLNQISRFALPMLRSPA